jgi:hypothetical protein
VEPVLPHVRFSDKKQVEQPPIYSVAMVPPPGKEPLTKEILPLYQHFLTQVKVGAVLDDNGQVTDFFASINCLECGGEFTIYITPNELRNSNNWLQLTTCDHCEALLEVEWIQGELNRLIRCQVRLPSYRGEVRVSRTNFLIKFF